MQASATTPPPTRLSLGLLLATIAAAHASAAPLGPQSVDEEGAIRNSTPLPAMRSAEQALAAGDISWARAAAAEGPNRAGPRNAAFDAWREALTTSMPGDGVRLAAPAGAFPFPDPGGTHARRSEGVSEAVKRRLAALSEEDQGAWRMRFDSLAHAAWERALASRDTPLGGLADTRMALARVERDFPFTRFAARAALALFDLSLEAGRPSAAGAWLARAVQQPSPPGPAWRAALKARRSALESSLGRRGGQDHTLPPPRRQ